MLKQRLLNTFRDFGDDMLRLSGVGEFASTWPLFGNPPPTNYTAALQFVAKQGRLAGLRGTIVTVRRSTSLH